MLSSIFQHILQMSLNASACILIVLLARLLLKKAPKAFSFALWFAVLLRLLCPISIVIPFNSTIQAMDTAEFGASAEAAASAGAQITVLPYIWLPGLLFILSYNIVSLFKLRSKLLSAVALESDIFIADHISAAFTIGIFHPRIYIPSALSIKERFYIIAHERHHLRRLDHITKLLAFAALCIHWFNPLVWLAFVLLVRDMEMSCDEAVIKKLGLHIRADYMASLLNLAAGRDCFSGITTAFSGGNTKGRIKNMAKWKRPSKFIITAALLVFLPTIAACAISPAPCRDGEAPAICTDPTCTDASHDHNGLCITTGEISAVPETEPALQTSSQYNHHSTGSDHHNGHHGSWHCP